MEVEIPMHVCIAGAKTCPPRIGGIEVFSYEIGKRLVSKGVKLTILVPRTRSESRTDSVDGIDVIRVPALHNRYSLKVSMIPGLMRAATIIRPDIFHANDPPSGFVSVLSSRWKSSVYTSHGVGVVSSEWPFPLRQGGKLLQMIAIKGATTAVATDEQTASVFKNYRNDIQIVPPGVDTDLFRRGAHSRPDSLDKDKLNVLFAGRLTKGKGADLFLRSLEHMDPEVLSGLRVTIVGDGPLRNLIRQLKLPQGVINWMGELPHNEIPPFFTHADLLVITSRSEGVPISMLEAMSADLPVVTTMVGGIASHFDDRHITKIESLSPQGIADAIERAVEDMKTLRRKATLARELATSRFSWDTIAQKYLEIYKSALIQ